MYPQNSSVIVTTGFRLCYGFRSGITIEILVVFQMSSLALVSTWRGAQQAREGYG
jgi:hypothetical protein